MDRSKIGNLMTILTTMDSFVKQRGYGSSTPFFVKLVNRTHGKKCDPYLRFSSEKTFQGWGPSA